jgi:hypothetical protein
MPVLSLRSGHEVNDIGQAAVEPRELALRLNPNFSLARGSYGLTLSYCGRWQEAALAASRALRLSPRDPLLAIYDEAMRLRVRPCASARILSARIGC